MIVREESMNVAPEEAITAPVEESETISINVEALVEAIGGIIGLLRTMKQERKAEILAEFKEQYKSLVLPILQIINFEKALSSIKIVSLDPKYSIALGFGILIGSAFLIPLPKPSEKHTEKAERVSEKAEKVIEKNIKQKEEAERIQEEMKSENTVDALKKKLDEMKGGIR